MTLYRPVADSIKKALEIPVIPERREILQPLINYIYERHINQRPINLNFICTHNSRRSQFSQIWAQVSAFYYGVPVHCFSGGVEVTEFNLRAVDSILRSGFEVIKQGNRNPHYFIKYSEDVLALECFSKNFDDPENPDKDFAAVMTCSHADENCPFIQGADARIPVRYEDPKAFDDTSLEAVKYDERSLQIASEMLYVFSVVNHQLSVKKSQA